MITKASEWSFEWKSTERKEYSGKEAEYENGKVSRRYILFPAIKKSQFDPNSPDYIPLYHDGIVGLYQKKLYGNA